MGETAPRNHPGNRSFTIHPAEPECNGDADIWSVDKLITEGVFADKYGTDSRIPDEETWCAMSQKANYCERFEL